jgi:transcriptional regulator with XRE-family HTH domain
MSEFGSRLRAARKYAKLTQVQLARASGIRQSSLSEAERSADGSAYTSQLAKSCGVDAHWLATGEGEMIPSNSTPEVRFTLPSDGDVIEIGHALQALDEHLQALAPVLQDAGRDILRKWLAGAATVDGAVQALEAMAFASKAMNKKE